ncbi:hypothetical protein BGZ72_009251 [Mortierella alpina]|nr:hypothetical protein BGZ72_009251 [Mortierella alpina]
MDNAFVHFLLPIGFATPKATKVISSTGYLVGTKTKQRIYETAQFVDNVVHSLDYLRPVSGTAWKSILRIRFLHSGVRARLLKFGHAYPKYYNLKDYGVPINQEDLLSVLFTCSSTMWQVLEKRMGIQMTTQDRKDYMHLWRYVGYILGVDDILGATQTPERADACQESIMLHLADPDSESGRLCSTMLQNLASEPTLFFKFANHIALLDQYKIHMALTEHLVGSEIWKEYGLPLASRRYRAYREVIVRLMSFDLWLVTTSPRWLRIRSSLFRKIQSRVIARKLGVKRSQHELKELHEKREEPVVIKMADDAVSGRL